MIEPEKLRKEKVNEITSKEVKNVMDNFVTQTLAENVAGFAAGDVVNATADALAGDWLTVEGFALWMSDKVGGGNETVQTLMFLTTTFAVLELGIY